MLQDLIPRTLKIKQRRRVNVSYYPSMVTAVQHSTWMKKQIFKKTCIEEKRQRRGIHQHLYGTWVADFMLRQDVERFMLGKYLVTKKSHGSEGDDWEWR